jgi:hypothetical protein
MSRKWILMACMGVLCASLVPAAAKSAKKINFSGTWVLTKSKVDQGTGSGLGSGGGMGRGGGRGMGRDGGGGGYPGGGNPGGGNPGGGGRPGGGRRGSEPGEATFVNESPITIEHNENELKVIHKVENAGDESKAQVQVFKLDGSESLNQGLVGDGEFKSRTSWNKEKLVTLGTEQPRDSDNSARSNVIIKQEFSLSKDGKTLTVKTSRTMTRGQVTTTGTYMRQTESGK